MSGTEDLHAMVPHLKMDQYVTLMCPVLAGNIPHNLMKIYMILLLAVAEHIAQAVHPNVMHLVATRNICSNLQTYKKTPPFGGAFLSKLYFTFTFVAPVWAENSGAYMDCTWAGSR